MLGTAIEIIVEPFCAVSIEGVTVITASNPIASRNIHFRNNIISPGFQYNPKNVTV
jgi:hypothetical protein